MTGFIDSNVLINAFTNNADQEKCMSMLRQHFVTNALCILEAQNAVARIVGSKLHAAACMKSLFKGSGSVVPVDNSKIAKVPVVRYDF